MGTVPAIEPKAPFAECHRCPLAHKPCARSLIPDNPVAAVVARSPGWKEAKTGEPFTGLSGKVLNHLLLEQGIKREEVLLTNVVLCAPDEGDVPSEAIKACAPRLRAELAGVELVIAAGREAVNLIIGRGTIDRHRGYRIQQDGRIAVATNNPALVLRDDSTFPNLRRDFRRAFNPIPPPVLPEVEVIEDGVRARTYIERLLGRSEPLISADIESRGGLSKRATLVTVQFSTDGRSATVLGEREGLWEDADFLQNYLRPLLESPNHRFIWHNGKFDTKVLRSTYGINARIDEDTMLMSYALDERSGQSAKEHGGIHKLESLLAEEYGWPDYEPESVKQFKKDGVVRDYAELHEYAGRDAAGTFQLQESFVPRLGAECVESAYRRLLLEGAEACARIELAGFPYDIVGAADLMEEEVQPELERKTQNMRKIIDDPILNPRSPTQISHIFYDRWQLRHAMQARPDMELSTDDATLNEIIAGRYKTKAGADATMVKTFTKELKRFRKLSKQADTYIVALIERASNDPESRLYTDLLLHGTTSGRLSSRNPNLQNITRSKEGLPDIRRLFLPSPGRLIVQADYSQAELRCIAHFSEDSELLRVYGEDLDLHGVAAANFYGSDFTSEQRSRAKNMNFGVAYGQGAATFQEKHEIPEREAQKFIDWWWKYFTGVAEWKLEIIKEMKTGYLTSPFGRRRRFHLITPENKNAMIREAVNFKPQSTAGDFTLRSVIVLANEIDWKKAAIVITVHDNIVGDVKESYVDEYMTICEQIMVSRPKEELGWTIPFKVDVGVGPTWADAK